MRKAENAFCLLLAGLSGLSIFIVFAVVFAGSVSRYAFSSPFQWSEEVAKYAMIYGCMFGTAYAYLRGSQISFSLVTDLLSEQVRTRLSVMVDAATLILGGVLIHAGLIFAGKRGGITSSGLGIPMYWAQIALSVGGVCLFVAAALRLLSALRRNRGGEQPS